jgi:glycerol-3-phosphate dehydrogenase (NAD(P)+)
MSKAIAVVGAGGWGIALAKVLADRGERITLWCHGAENYRELRETRESRAYLPGVLIPATVDITRSMEQAVRDQELIVCAVPSHGVREVMAQAASFIGPQALVLCCTKGLEEQSLKTMGEVLAEVFGETHSRRHAFLSGPTFAVEVACGLPAAATVAARLEEVAQDVQETMRTQNFRVYTSGDVMGVQMGGVIKNIIAIAAGISDGLRLGHNARAALMTRGLAEMTRLSVRMGAEPMTLAGLPGLGDLVLTCTGDLSRNRKAGLDIAQGKSAQEITQETRTVAEGIRNTRSVYLLSRRLEVEMPIVEQMYRVLYERKEPLAAVRDLMQRSLKSELS